VSAPDRPTGGLSYLPGLDGLRALSVGAVLAGHSGATLPLWRALGPDATARAEPLVGATTGVQVFFVLSGLLITRLLLAEHESTGSVRLGRFYARRLLRLTPPFAAFLLVVGALLLAGALPASDGRGFAWAALYLYNLVPRETATPLLASLWSLAVEEQFYLVLPALVLAAGRRLLPVLAVAAGVLLAADLALRASPWMLTHTVERWPTGAFPTLFVGCVAGVLWTRGVRVRAAWLAPSALAYGVTLWAPALPEPVATLVRSAGVAGAVLWLLAHPDARATRLLESAPLRHVGRLSYALYLWQGLFLTTNPNVWAGPYDMDASWAANAARAAADGALALLRLPPISLAATYLAAVASYRWIERPVLRWRDRRRPGAAGA
jgi:peptidoglycan/LPS O-acetylase OafA/YrhL